MAGAGDLTQEQVAVELGVSPRTLEKWRLLQFGPVPYRAGRGPKAPVRYTRASIDAFKASQAAWTATA